MDRPSDDGALGHRGPGISRRRWSARGLHAGAAVLAEPHFAVPRTPACQPRRDGDRSEEHTSELQSLMRISYAVFCLKNKINSLLKPITHHTHVVQSLSLHTQS